jgi:hypothetical protein
MKKNIKLYEKYKKSKFFIYLLLENLWEIVVNFYIFLFLYLFAFNLKVKDKSYYSFYYPSWIGVKEGFIFNNGKICFVKLGNLYFSKLFIRLFKKFSKNIVKKIFKNRI